MYADIYLIKCSKTKMLKSQKRYHVLSVKCTCVKGKSSHDAEWPDSIFNFVASRGEAYLTPIVQQQIAFYKQIMQYILYVFLYYLQSANL